MTEVAKLTKSQALDAILIGGAVPFLFCSFAINAVSRAATGGAKPRNAAIHGSAGKHPADSVCK